MQKPRLRRLPVFENVSEVRLHRLESHLEERDYRSNEAVYRAGAPCDGMYAVLRGAVVLRAENPGEPVGVGLTIAAGEVFGQSEVLERTPRELTARALCPTALVRIPLDPLLGLLADEPDLGMSLRSLTTRRRVGHARTMLASPTRKEPRIWVDRDVILTLGNGLQVTARLEDLSGGGACIAAAPDTWQVGSRVIFTLGVDGHPNLLQARGVVRWRDESLVGICFDSIGPIHRMQVSEALRVLGPSRAEAVSVH
jgi:CRP-like cAMP-binding protein